VRTARAWLGIASRWTATGSQRDVEEPTTVVVVGVDHSDAAELWLGYGNGQLIRPSVGLRPGVDAFVSAVAATSQGGPFSAPVGQALRLSVQPNGAATVEAAPTFQGFLRSSFPTVPVVSFVEGSGVPPSGVDAILTQNDAPPGNAPANWTTFPAPGLLVRVGQTLWLTMQGVALPFRMYAQWAGS